jgi:hypothetical protein
VAVQVVYGDQAVFIAVRFAAAEAVNDGVREN